ncbi:hypothetical protein GIB67_031476, partial [Kingdonia uniflora]
SPIPTSIPSLSPPTNPRNHHHNFPKLLIINRHNLLLSLGFALSTTTSTPSFPPLFNTPNADARRLFQMPPLRLNNRYFLVRVGESEYESLGIIRTNPVAKTSVHNGFLEEGKRQTLRSAFSLKTMGTCEGSCWIWPSITQRAYQSVEIIAAVNKVNQM